MNRISQFSKVFTEQTKNMARKERYIHRCRLCGRSLRLSKQCHTIECNSLSVELTNMTAAIISVHAVQNSGIAIIPQCKAAEERDRAS